MRTRDPPNEAGQERMAPMQPNPTPEQRQDLRRAPMFLKIATKSTKKRDTVENRALYAGASANGVLRMRSHGGCRVRATLQLQEINKW